MLRSSVKRPPHDADGLRAVICYDVALFRRARVRHASRARISVPSTTARVRDVRRRFMASRAELSQFLESIERPAYKQAAYAVRDDASALDIVQDAMIKLAERYGDKPANEWPMLFQ